MMWRRVLEIVAVPGALLWALVVIASAFLDSDKQIEE